MEYSIGDWFQAFEKGEKAFSTYILLIFIFDFVFVCICYIFFLHVCELFYIVSFVVKSPSGGKNPWKTADANPRRSLFENCFKSWFDTARWWGMSCAFDFLRNYWFRCFLRRVMVIFRQQKNFGPNVRYCVFGYHFGLSSWSSIDHVTSHSRVVALLNWSLFLRIIRSLYKNKTLREWLATWSSGPY